MIHHQNFSVCCYWLTYVHYSHYECIVTHKPTLPVLNVRSRCLLLQFTAIKAVLFFHNGLRRTFQGLVNNVICLEFCKSSVRKFQPKFSLPSLKVKTVKR